MVWHQGLFYKLLRYDTSGNIYNGIKDMYLEAKTQLKLKDGLSDNIFRNNSLQQG